MKVITDRRDVVNMLFDTSAPHLNKILFKGIYFDDELLHLCRNLHTRNSNLMFIGCTFLNTSSDKKGLTITCKEMIRFQDCHFTNIELNVNIVDGSCIFNNVDCDTEVYINLTRSKSLVVNSNIHRIYSFIPGKRETLTIINSKLQRVLTNTSMRVSDNGEGIATNFLSINKSEIEVLDLSQVYTGLFGVKRGDPLLKHLFDSGIDRVYLPKFIANSDISGIDISNAVLKRYTIIDHCNVKDLDLSGTYNGFNKGIMIVFQDCTGFDSTLLPEGVKVVEEVDQYFKVYY